MAAHFLTWFTPRAQVLRRAGTMLLLLVLMVGPRPVHADDLIVARDLLEDPAGTLTINDVTQARFQPVGPLVTKGYSKSTFWLRIVVRAPVSPTGIELRIRPTFLDEVRLYEATPKGWMSRATGDRHPFAERDRAAITLGFVVRPTQVETTYYLRLQTTSSSLLYVEALLPHEAQEKDFMLLLRHAGFVAVMLWILVSSLHNYIAHRERLTLWFMLDVGSHLVYIGALNGYLAPLVPTAHPEWADIATSIVISSLLFWVALFLHPLLQPYDLPRPFGIIIRLSMLTFPASLIMIGTGHTQQAMQFIAESSFLLGILNAFLPWVARSEGDLSRALLRTTFGLQSATLLPAVLSVLGIIPPVEWTLDNAMLHVLISALLMFYVFNRRSLMRRRKHAQNEMQLTLLQEVLHMERRQREEQGRFMAMLVHELKTPMSVVRMALGLRHASDDAKHHAQLALQDMNAIVERCRQADQLEHPSAQPQRIACSLNTLIEDLCRASSASHRLYIDAVPTPDLESDPQLLRVIVGNLVDNAIKYSATGSPIRVRLNAHCEPAELHLSIENTPGLAGLPDPDQLFEKYYRSPHAHHQTGSGLGLYLVRGFAEQLGGRIEYQAVKGNARFTLCIPC